jgi:triosephosphate isomerase
MQTEAPGMAGAERAWIGTSWKMTKTLAGARVFADGLARAAVHPAIQPFVVPPFTLVREVAALLGATGVKVGAQNMHWADAGAWTGEVSPVMLADCGADLVELGHSERRAFFGETDETVGLKVAAAMRHGLVPLICVGETEDERAAGHADAVLRRQVEAALGRVADAAGEMLLAYEPVWAIGEGGVPAAPAYADDRQARIVEVARGVTGRRVPCLYGGSVTAANCAALLRQPHVDGLFIGRAAWEVGGYLDILARCAAVLDATEGEADEDRDRR